MNHNRPQLRHVRQRSSGQCNVEAVMQALLRCRQVSVHKSGLVLLEIHGCTHVPIAHTLFTAACRPRAYDALWPLVWLQLERTR